MPATGHDDISLMPLRHLKHAKGFLYQESGPTTGHPVIYLPGVHGCWTPLDRAREGLGKSLRLIEVTYPLKTNWSLAEYSAGLMELMDKLDIDSAHLVGESFGSLVGWQTGKMAPDRLRSHILVGGFCTAPPHYRAAAAAIGLTVLPTFVFGLVVDGYIALKGATGSPRILQHVKPYPAVRNTSGQKATANRMRLIQNCDFKSTLESTHFQVRYLGGANDTVIPVKREIQLLQTSLPDAAGFQSCLVPGAPHALIATHATESVKTIVDWIEHMEISLEQSVVNLR